MKDNTTSTSEIQSAAICTSAAPELSKATGRPQLRVRTDLQLFVPAWLCDFLPSLKGAALPIFVSYVSKADKESYASPSVALLSKESGYGEGAVRSARALLIGMGLLHPIDQKRQKGRYDTQIFKVALNRPEENLHGAATTVRHLPHGGESGAVLQTSTTTTDYANEGSPDESLQNPLLPGGERGALGEREAVGERDAVGVRDAVGLTNAELGSSSNRGKRGFGGKRGILPAKKRETSIREAYEKDVSEQSLSDFLKQSDSHARDGWAESWRTFNELFPGFNKDMSHVSWSFGCLLLVMIDQYADRIRSRSLKRGFFCCKVIDEAMEDGIRYDPDFQEMRRLLRKKETSDEDHAAPSLNWDTRGA
jgi:hypothetical protein